MCDQGQGLCSGCNPWQASGERDGRDHCLWVSWNCGPDAGVGEG